MNNDFFIEKKTLLWRWKFTIIKFYFIDGIGLEDYIRYKIIEEIMIVNNSNMNAYFMNYWYFNIWEYNS